MIIVNINNKNVLSKFKEIITTSLKLKEEVGGIVLSTLHNNIIIFNEIITIRNIKNKKEHAYRPDYQQLQQILKSREKNKDISLFHTHLENNPPSIFDINFYYSFTLKYNTISPHVLITPNYLYLYSLYPFHVAINNTVFNSSIAPEYNSTGIAEFEDELLYPHIVKIPLSII